MAKRKKPKKLNLVKLKINKQIKSTIWPNNHPTFLQNPSFTFINSKFATYTSSKKKKKGYCVLFQLRRLPWPINHAASVLLGVYNATPRRQHWYTSFSLAALSFVFLTLLLCLLITTQHYCEAVHFESLTD